MNQTHDKLCLRDSGYRWLGTIPTHWTTAEIRRIADVRLGKMLQSAPSGPDDTELPYVSAINVQPEGLSVEPKKSMWFSRAEQQNLTVEPGDVLVVEGGSVGRSVHLPDGLEGWRFQNSINRVRAKPALSVGAFLDYALKHLQSEGVIEMVCNKATIMHLTAEKLGRLRIAVPSVSEQVGIVSFLDRETAEIDAFIADQVELIELLRERRAATITQAVTKGLDLGADMKGTGVEWFPVIPKHWVMQKGARSARLIQTGPFGSQVHASDYIDGGTPLINPKHIVDGRIVPDLKSSVSFEMSEELSRHRLMKNDIIAGRRGELGRSAVVTEKEAGYLCGTGSLIIRLRDDAYVPRFFQLVFSSKQNRDALLQESVGATMDNLSAETIAKLRLPAPPISEQLQILEYLDFEITEIEAAIADAKKAIELSKERRAALISAAITGKIDVQDHITAELGAA